MFKKLALAAVSVFAIACGGGGGGGALFCTFSTGGTQSCAGYSGLTGAERTAEETACKDESGTTASSCPSSGLVGCCTTKASGSGQTFTTEACYYAGTAADLQSACTSANGTWSTSS